MSLADAWPFHSVARCRDPDHRPAIEVIQNLETHVITSDGRESSPGITVRIESVRAADQAQKCRLKKIVLGTMTTAMPVRVRKINGQRPGRFHEFIARDQVATAQQVAEFNLVIRGY